MYPLILKPVIKDYIWGGTRLKKEYGYNSDKKVLAEGWVLSCHKDGSNTVLNGEFKGKDITEVLAIWGKGAIGENFDENAAFPILIKLIDAEQKLSLQVHPDDEYALKNEGENGKTEMWYVVSCKKGAKLVYGLSRDITKEEFAKRIEDNTITEVLNFVPVHKGDVFFIPSGTVHAIGEGILIAEVQQNSNSTYRVSDYGRLGADGKPRPLHIEKALDVMDFKKMQRPYGDIGKTVKFETFSERELCSCDKFLTKTLDIDGETTIKGEKSFVSLVVLDGKATLKWENGFENIKKGDSIFVPYKMNVKIEGKVQILYSEAR